MHLLLPTTPVRDRVSTNFRLHPDETRIGAELDGPGCIRHIFLVFGRHPLIAPGQNISRSAIIRIYFDDEPVPYVEAPVGDLFGVMHGRDWYPLDNHYLSVKAWNGYNCYFPMPFARTARVEFENGPDEAPVFLQVDWERFPDQELSEPRRFCARWRREMPTERYSEDFLMLDADGPGELVGFVYGVRLIDQIDRWSHGGSDNIYIDGEGEYPAYVRGIGGEDTFGAGYGGALHPPEAHHYAAMPYYTHEDVGEARVAQRVVGYRFFEADPVIFHRSLHMRFGCMANDICSTVYWYQSQPVRPFFRMPPMSQLRPGVDLPRGSCDLPLPESGSWWLCGPFGNAGNRAMTATLPAEMELMPGQTFDADHEPGSPWLSEGSRQLGRDVARWIRRAAIHEFVDFNHCFQPVARGVGITHTGVALARCDLEAPAVMDVQLRVTWDDDLVLWVNDERYELGHHPAFRSQTLRVALREGTNSLVLKLSNTRGSNHGGWVFAFHASAADGVPLLPHAPAGL